MRAASKLEQYDEEESPVGGESQEDELEEEEEPDHEVDGKEINSTDNKSGPYTLRLRIPKTST